MYIEGTCKYMYIHLIYMLWSCMYTVCIMSYHVHTVHIACTMNLHVNTLQIHAMVMYVHCMYMVCHDSYHVHTVYIQVHTLSSLYVQCFHTGICNLVHTGCIQGIVHSLICSKRVYTIITFYISPCPGGQLSRAFHETR